MSDNQREHLRSIRSFPSLVKYLHEELDWPIRKNDFEDYTFEYTPEELGIDVKNAAKIQEIKRLRPFSANQPWGIFFVKFEPKQLPVVALRRILNQVVLKRRASANSVDRTAWEMDDLLFVSNYGEGDERRISFAHFKQEIEGSLPSLKVLGWDNLDTPLHLDHIATELREKLHWPSDVDNTEQWREAWRSAFTISHREVVTSSIILAIRLAELARAIRDRARSILKIETQDGPVTKLMAAFKESLIHDLNEDDFSDMYAQTIAYGLLSARIANPTGDTSDNFSEHMSGMNPFLKELMETFLHPVAGKTKKAKTEIDFDELGVSDVIELLDNTNIEAVVRDFGDRNPLEDPVIHFYELFLKEYDAEKRMQRGVFYTPRPVVSFIVRSVDELLRTEFGLEDGLADITTWGEMAERFDNLAIPDGATSDQEFVQILDPATGTGTFLVEVIDLIYKTMTKKWEKQYGGLLADVQKRWNEYVPIHLLPRLFGYELLMAPYAIAHMKIGLKLFETGYRFGNNERIQVYLTNTLEPAHDFTGLLDFAIPALAHEAELVNTIKRKQRFSVIIGNPPYSKSSANRNSEAESFVEKYKKHVRDERNIQPLSDDYLKFLGYSHNKILVNGFGICSLVTNRGFLAGVLHRGVRKQLQNDFDLIHICDIHGDSNVGEDIPEGYANENVFDIQQGVAICVLACTCTRKNSYKSFLRDVWGTRFEKYDILASKTSSEVCLIECFPDEQFFFFREESCNALSTGVMSVGLDSIFERHQGGIKTHRDALVIDFDLDSLKAKISKFIRSAEDDEMYSVRKILRADDDLNSKFKKILYRPFDYRYIFYHPAVIDRPRYAIMKHMLICKNIGLLGVRQVPSGIFNHAFVTEVLSEMKTCSHDRGADLFPLFVCSEQNELLSDCNYEVLSNFKQVNISQTYLDQFAILLGFDKQHKKSDKSINLEHAISMFSYIYAILYSPSYRTEQRSLLQVKFAEIPLSGASEMAKKLCVFGSELISLHLMRSPLLNRFITNPVNSDIFQVDSVSFSDNTVWIDRALTKGFYGVPEDVWNFHIGGYQVCKKWLKDRQAKGGKNPRPGKLLTDDDIEHYQKIVVAINETIRIMKEIDEVIERYGGWPDAFRQTE